MSGLSHILLAYIQRLQNSLYFAFAGALGGLLGVIGNELYMLVYNSGSEVSIASSAYYFAFFAGCVGFGLGITEGLLLRVRSMAAYGAIVGLVLGLLGGWAGGVLGQSLFSLFPPSYSSSQPQDFVLALDSSGSMAESDPRRKRINAARQLISKMGTHQRIALVDFDDHAEVIFPLTYQTSEGRYRAYRALSRIDDAGGTNLSFAVLRALRSLDRVDDPDQNRKKSIILLTDGMGKFDLSLTQEAKSKDISIYVIGLGPFVERSVLENIATSPDKYYGVEQAGSLAKIFGQIYYEAVRVTDHIEEKHGEAVLVTNPWWLFILRVVSWTLIGLMIGLGQGFRENKKEELVWCTVGGAIGGLLGGVTFDSVAAYFAIDTISRITSGIVVGFFIGGALRLTQQGMILRESEYISIDDDPRYIAGGLVIVEDDSERKPSSKIQSKPQKGMITFLPTKEDFIKRQK